MARKDKIPEIRFAGFTNAWEQCELGEIGKAKSGVGFPDGDQGGTEGTPFYKVSDMNLYGNEHEMVTANNYVTDEQIASHNWKPIQQVPAIFFAKVGAAVMLNRKRLVRFPFLFDNNTMAYMFDESLLDTDFGKILFETIDLTSLVQVGALPSYNASDVEGIEVYLPDMYEQSQIGRFFRQLVNLITLHQRKYDKLLIVKKSMLEKMFPKDGANVPEIRFAVFTDAWEQQQVGDVLTEKQRPIKMEDDKEYQLVRVKRRNEGIVSRGYFKGKDILVKNYFEVRSGDYLISKRQVIHGANGIVPENLDKSIVSNEYLVVIGNKNISTEYWTLISKRPNMYRQFFLSSYGVDIEKLVFDVVDWKKRTIILPSVPEQERITMFFQRLDHLISLHQSKLEKLKNIKKSILEKMFV